MHVSKQILNKKHTQLTEDDVMLLQTTYFLASKIDDLYVRYGQVLPKNLPNIFNSI